MTAGRVLMVTAHFAPQNVSGTHRPLHFARSLVDAGFEVDVVTITEDRIRSFDPALRDVFPYPDSIHRVRPRTTLGELYSSLKTALGRSGGAAGAGSAGGATGAATTSRRGLRSFVAELDVFPDPYASWRRPATRRAIQAGRARGVCAVFASGPPWSALRAGAAAARELGVPFIADFRDPWTAHTGASTPAAFPVLDRLAVRWEREALAAARVVLFNSPGLAAHAAAHYPEPEFPAPRTIFNGSSAPRRAAAVEIDGATPLRFRHFGTLYQGRSMDPLISALCRVPELRADVATVELFGVSSWPVPVQLPRGIEVATYDTLPHSEALVRMQEPAVLVLVQPNEFAQQIPTKLFEYLATGNPILIVAPTDGAAWQLGRRFARCHLLDPAHEETAAGVAELVRKWRAGRLRQERTVEDTAALTKAAVGAEFVELVRAICTGPA